jgi:hypothetical protein
VIVAKAAPAEPLDESRGTFDTGQQPAQEAEDRIQRPVRAFGVSNVIDPRHIVATQLNTLTPVGTAISIVANMKNNSTASGMPVANM